MLKRFTSLLSLSALILVAACGRNLKELSSQEKERFQNTLATIGHSTKAIATIGSKNKSASSPSSSDRLFETMGAGSAPSRESEEIARRLEKAIAGNECEVVKNVPEDLGQGKSFKVSDARVILKGTACPISMDLTLTADGSEKNGSAKFTLKYEVKDPELRDLAQIDRVDLSGSLSFSTNVPKDPGSDFSVKLNVDMNGTAHSLKEGDMKTYLRGKIDMNGNAQAQKINGGGEFAFGIEFKDFTGELKTVGTMNSTGKSESKFFLNEKEISETEMKEWLSAAGLPNPPAFGPSTQSH